MSVYHDDVEIDDFEYDPDTDEFTSKCPCGDVFRVTADELLKGQDTATCDSCSLVVKVIYDAETLPETLERLKNKYKQKKAQKLTN